MDFINDRYKIALSIKDEQDDNLFLATDLYNNNRMKMLRVIKPELCPESVLEYFRRNFIAISTLKHPNLTEAFSFSIIKTMDGERISTKQFYYTYEYVKGENIFDISENMDQEGIIDLIVQVLNALKYLHRRGFLYRNIDTKNITVTTQNDRYIVKLNGIIVPEHIEKVLFKDIKSRNQFRSPEVLKDENFTIHSDFYSLGVLFFYLITRENPNKGNFLRLLQDYKDNNVIYKGPLDYKYFIQFLDVIAKLTSDNSSDRYYDIVQVVRDLNSILGRNYSCFSSEYLGKLITKTVLVGRDDCIKKLYAWKDEAFSIKDKTRMVFIDGELGMGKSRLLKEFSFQMETEGIRTFTINAMENEASIYGAIKQLVRQIIPAAGIATIMKYGPELKKIIPDEKKLRNLKPSQVLPGDREKNRLKFCTINFILDTIKDRGAVITFDNSQWIDALSLEFIDYLIECSQRIPLMIIMACRTEDCRKDSHIKHYLDKWNDRELLDNLTLKQFDLQEMGEMVKNLLGIGNIPRIFSTYLLNETQGNPLFVRDILSYLIAEKKLYLNFNGYWSTDYDDDTTYTRMSLPSNINEAVLKQIDILAIDSKRILEMISVFYFPVSLSTISEIASVPNEALSEIIDMLVSKQILEYKVDDWGILYDFHSTAVKNEIYNRIEIKRRKEMHKLYASILEKLNNAEGRINSDELIYQYCEADEPEKALKYIIKCAELMMSLHMNEQALGYLSRGLSISRELSLSESSSKILYMTGELYYHKGENDKAIECLAQALSISCSSGDTTLELECCIRLGNIYNRINEQDKAFDIYKRAEELSKRTDNTERLLDVYAYLSRTIGILKNDYHTALEIVDRALEQYGDSDYYFQLGALYNQKGALLLSIDKADESLEYLEKSIGFYEMAGSPDDISRPTNNTGVVYVKSMQDFKKAMYYFEKGLEIELKRGHSERLVIQYQNIGIVTSELDDYVKALDYLYKSDEIAQEIGNESSYFSLSNSFLYIFMRMGNYSRALEFLNKSRAILDKNPDQSWNIPEFYKNAAQFYYDMGLFEDAKMHASTGIDRCDESNESESLECRRHLSLSKYHLKSKTELDEFKNVLDLYRKSRMVRDRRVALHRFAEVYIAAGEKEKAAKLIKESRELVTIADTRLLGCELLYLDGIYHGDIKGIKELQEAESMCSEVEDKPMLWKIHKAMGDIYLQRDDKFNAVIFYLKSLDILYKMYITVPVQYRASFLRSHNRSIPREKLLSIKYDMIKELEQDIENKLTLGLKEDSCFLGAFFDEMDLPGLTSGNQANAVYKALDTHLTIQKIISEVLSNLSNDLEWNLEIIMDALCHVTAAENCFIVSGEGEEKKIHRYSKNRCSEFKNEYVIEYTREKAEGIFSAEIFENRYGNTEIIMPQGIRALMCVPVTGTSHPKRSAASKHLNIKGYIYLDTCSMQNNFVLESLEMCRTFANLISISMENNNLKIISSMDKLTGVYTRKYFESAMEEQLKRAELDTSKFSIIMIDIDLFKNFNDRYGHQKGDEVLRIVGEKLLANTRSEDICCRYGGEEFVIILPDTGIKQTENIAERLRKAVEDTKFMGLNDKLTISLGISGFPKHGKMKDELIRKADQALYRSKGLGRNRCCTWNSKIKENATKVDMLTGIVNGNFVHDQRNILGILEAMDIANKVPAFDDKIYNILGRIMEALDAEQSMLVIYPGQNRKNKKVYARKRFVDGWLEEVKYSTKIVNKAASSSSGLSTIDWDDMDSEDVLTGLPSWNSVIALPINSGERLKGVLYLTSPVSSIEYGPNELNFANAFAKIVSIILNGEF